MEFEKVLTYVDRCVYDFSGQHLTLLQQEILRCSWKGQSYQEMASSTGGIRGMHYKPTTLKNVHGYELWQLLKKVWPGEKMSKPNFQKIMLKLLTPQDSQGNGLSSGSQISTQALYCVPKFAGFTQVEPHSAPVIDPYRIEGLPLNLLAGSSATYGYELVLQRIVERVQQDCRLVILTGAKGIGKTTFLSHLFRRLQPQFADYFCRSAEDVSTLNDWYLLWQRVVSQSDPLGAQTQPEQTQEEAQQVRQILKTLQQHRHLLVFDQTEHWLQAGTLQFKSASSGYEALLRRLATDHHQSCLIWVGQVEPPGLPSSSRVVIETLSGISLEAIAHLPSESELSLSGADQEALMQRCGGNPAIWQAALNQIKRHQSGKMENFKQHPFVEHSSLTACLTDMVSSLSGSEWALLYWLALQSFSFEAWQNWPTVIPLSPREREIAWARLQQQHLLRSDPVDSQRYCLHPPLLGTYVVQQLVNQLIEELRTEQLDRFHQYPLCLTTATWQAQLEHRQRLLEPLAKALAHDWGDSESQLQTKIRGLLAQVRQRLGDEGRHDSESISTAIQLSRRSCAAGNLINLAIYLKLPLTLFDWTGLIFWYADFSDANLQRVTFHDCQFYHPRFASGLTQNLVAALHPQGHFLAIGDANGRIGLYQQVLEGFCLGGSRLLPDTEDGSTTICHILITSNNGLVVATDQPKVYVWESCKDLRQTPSQIETAAQIQSLSMSPTEELLAIGLEDGRVLFWNLITEETEVIEAGHDLITHLNFCPEGIFLSTYDKSNQVLIWQRAETTYLIRELELDADGTFLAWYWRPQPAPQPPGLVLFEYLESQICWHIHSEQANSEKQVLTDSQVRLHKISLSENGDYLALIYEDCSLQIWQLNLPQCIARFSLDDLPEEITLTNDGKILICQKMNRVDLWSIPYETCFNRIESVSDPYLYRGCTFPDVAVDKISLPERAIAILLGAEFAAA